MTRGARRHLVTLQNPGSATPDNEGGFTQTWANCSPSTRFAEIMPATARDLERTVANAVESTASHILTFDYHPQVTTKTRILFGTRIFHITGLKNPAERRIDQVAACVEVVT